MSKSISLFISVDMEGAAAVVAGDEVKEGETDFEQSRRLVTEETNAAVKAAFDAGVDEVLVKDAHATARNIMPEELDGRAQLYRGWSGRPAGMMDGLEENFNMAAFVGYHAGAGTEDSVLAHTYSGKFSRIVVNDILMSEALLNALYADYIGVPVGFISGDEKTCEQAGRHFSYLETAAVKWGDGEGVRSLSPLKAREKISRGIKSAVNSLDRVSGPVISPPFDTEVKFKRRSRAVRAGCYPGADKRDTYSVEISCKNALELLTFIHFVS